jgi:hypothetical protein
VHAASLSISPNCSGFGSAIRTCLVGAEWYLGHTNFWHDTGKQLASGGVGGGWGPWG